MKIKTCYQIKDLPFGITLEQTGKNSFTVTYGLQVSTGLTYSQAAKELGLCIMHAAACAGTLDNEV